MKQLPQPVFPKHPKLYFKTKTNSFKLLFDEEVNEIR